MHDLYPLWNFQRPKGAKFGFFLFHLQLMTMNEELKQANLVD